MSIRGRAALEPPNDHVRPRTTALVLIDLQNGILGMPLAPRSGAEVLATATELAARSRAAGAAVVPVHVGWSAVRRCAEAAGRPADAAAGRQPARRLERSRRRSGRTRRYRRHQAAMGRSTAPISELQLRRRGVTTIVLGGIATDFGVESTARGAWEHGYAVVVAEDATTSLTAEMHPFSVEHILPRIGIVSRAADIRLEQA